MGRVFRLSRRATFIQSLCLNPRFVGRVFRLRTVGLLVCGQVLIPDLWGESSDTSDNVGADDFSLNPRFVGRVFRHHPKRIKQQFTVLIPDLWGESSDASLNTDDS